VAIYGTDYPTGDGTCVREVLESVQRVAGKLTIREEARREGDPPVLIARAERIRSALV
jgi:UDP-glucose 4-epimerase